MSIGLEVPLKDTLTETFLFASESLNVKCFQVYLGNPAKYQVNSFSEEDLSIVKDLTAINYYIHCPLICNMALADPVLAIEAVQKELNIIAKAPGSCVLHIGKKGTISNVIRNINRLVIPNINRRALLLEVAAGQGTELGTNWDEVRQVFEGIDTSRIGICLDTQHMFASRMSDLRDPASVDTLFDEVESILGHEPDLFHLNDSKKDFGSHVDRHENIGEGYIWLGDTSGLKTLISRSLSEGIDMILETPNSLNDLLYLNKR